MAKYKDSTGRKSDFSPIKDIFEELLQAYSLKDRYNERKVITAWGEIMGNTVSKRTSELSVRDRKLYVKLSSGPVKKELMMNKSKVLQLIADKFGNNTIEDIIFL
jgi:predicted nucleic acid-binding Zn ribbon protein